VVLSRRISPAAQPVLAEERGVAVVVIVDPEDFAEVVDDVPRSTKIVEATRTTHAYPPIPSRSCHHQCGRVVTAWQMTHRRCDHTPGYLCIWYFSPMWPSGRVKRQCRRPGLPLPRFRRRLFSTQASLGSFLTRLPLSSEGVSELVCKYNIKIFLSIN